MCSSRGMANKKRIWEPVSGPLSPEYLTERITAGWRLVGIEWERETTEAPALAREEWIEEIPYGLRLSPDCARLVGNPSETDIIVNALDMIVEDCPLSLVADHLNQRGYRTRAGTDWTAGALFELLPRMIQVAPRVFASEEWLSRRLRLPKAPPDQRPTQSQRGT